MAFHCRSVCSSLPLPVHVWLFFLPQLALASQGPRKVQIFVLPIQIALLPATGLSRARFWPKWSMWAACFLRVGALLPPGGDILQANHHFHFWQRKTLRSTFFYHSLPHLSSGSRPLSPQMSSSCMSPLRRPGEDAMVFLPAWDWKPMERRLVPSRLPDPFIYGESSHCRFAPAWALLE